jgi:hypothetical protein
MPDPAPPPADPEFVAFVRELFVYEPTSGELRHRVDKWAGEHRNVLSARAGDRAGWASSGGYLRVKVAGRTYGVHRVAFLIVEGRWPSAQLDHIDGDKNNNRMSNLREVDNRTNNENRRHAHRNSQSGLLGAFPHRKRWQSRIRVNGKLRNLGCFATAEEAHQAYLKAKREHHAGCTL